MRSSEALEIFCSSISGFIKYTTFHIPITSASAVSSICLNLRDIPPRHHHQPNKPLLHVNLDIPRLPHCFMSLSRQFDIRRSGLPVLMCHGEDNVALVVGAFELADEHAAVGDVDVEGAVEEAVEVGDCLGGGGWSGHAVWLK